MLIIFLSWIDQIIIKHCWHIFSVVNFEKTSTINQDIFPAAANNTIFPHFSSVNSHENRIMYPDQLFPSCFLLVFLCFEWNQIGMNQDYKRSWSFWFRSADVGSSISEYLFSWAVYAGTIEKIQRSPMILHKKKTFKAISSVYLICFSGKKSRDLGFISMLHNISMDAANYVSRLQKTQTGWWAVCDRPV